MGLSKTDGRTARQLAFALACLASLTLPCHAEILDAHYVVTLMGLKIGELNASGSMQPQNYRMDLNAHLSGLAAMVSSVKMALASTGGVNKHGVLAPSTYATSAVGSNETRTLRMALNAGTVKAVEISPPPEFRGERVP